MKCHSAKEQAIDNNIGNAEDSILNLAAYFKRLKQTNPGTIIAIETELDDFGDSQFLYAFHSFGASIQGFRRLRPVLIVDGTHLAGKYKRVLLTASGQDANFQVFPIAFSVVDWETDSLGSGFFRRLRGLLLIQTLFLSSQIVIFPCLKQRQLSSPRRTMVYVLCIS